jgi:ATP-dependent RNA circularization protein (DNA/RNA ligase family)
MNIYNGTLFRYKEELNYVVCRKIVGTEEPHVKRSIPGSEKQSSHVFLSYDRSKR